MANEKRLIDALPLMKNGWHLVQTGESNRFLRSMSLADIPTVDAVEVVHGRWIRYEHGSGIYCSECKRKRRYKDEHDTYCPNCGADMRERREGEWN